ncbi:hypothetical protein KAT51_00980 [bacterium]|nr:hypothetical protein [bacterium]
MGDKEKKVKSFYLKKSNIDKVEAIAFKNKIKQSQIVDEAIEEYEYVSR